MISRTHLGIFFIQRWHSLKRSLGSRLWRHWGFSWSCCLLVCGTWVYGGCLPQFIAFTVIIWATSNNVKTFLKSNQLINIVVRTVLHTKVKRDKFLLACRRIKNSDNRINTNALFVLMIVLLFILIIYHGIITCILTRES